MRAILSSDLNKNREKEGEYHTFFSRLKKHPDKFFVYCRMDEETFNIVLDAIKDTIQKSETNFRKPTSPEDRLLVTLRTVKVLGFSSTVSFLIGK
ncbi:hypothetical protein QTP88_011093 [Uroleucon formosanum]